MAATIVLVDDEPVNDYTVLEASGYDEAVEILAREGNRVDLVLTDLAMPGKGGSTCVPR